MKIALIINDIEGRGGIEKNYRLWFEGLSKKAEVYLFVLDKPKRYVKNNVIYLEGNNIRQKGKFLEKKLTEIGEFDLIILNAEYLKKYIPQHYFISVHNTWALKGNIFKKISKWLKLNSKYRNEDLIGISKSVLDNITDNLKIPVKSKHVVYAPHDIKQVRNLAEEFEVKEKYIVSVASLRKNKGIDVLIKSFYKIKDNISHNLYILGDGPEKKNLIKLTKKLNLEDRVKFLGYKSNPYPYIKNASLFVLPSRSEGLPRVVVESLILHTPVVCTRSSKGVDEVMVNELQNYVVPVDNVEKLSEKILLALNEYPKITQKYYQKFDIENSINTLLSLSTYHETNNTEKGIS